MIPSLPNACICQETPFLLHEYSNAFRIDSVVQWSVGSMSGSQHQNIPNKTKRANVISMWISVNKNVQRKFQFVDAFVSFKSIIWFKVIQEYRTIIW